MANINSESELEHRFYFFIHGSSFNISARRITSSDMVMEIFPIKLTVENKVKHVEPLHYLTSVVEGGILVSALRRLHDNDKKFKFTVKNEKNFGLFLESVNGEAGSQEKKTYWELLSKKGGKEEPLTVGVGAYVPEKNEEIILRFTHY